MFLLTIDLFIRIKTSYRIRKKSFFSIYYVLCYKSHIFGVAYKILICKIKFQTITNLMK